MKSNTDVCFVLALSEVSCSGPQGVDCMLGANTHTGEALLTLPSDRCNQVGKETTWFRGSPLENRIVKQYLLYLLLLLKENV